jgi:hypothetical protein
MTEATAPMTRAQRRIQERVADAAGNTHRQLCQKFFDFFMGADEPEGDEVKKKQKEFSAKWKMYCKRSQFKPEALPLFDEYANKLIADYKAEKDAN